MKKINLNKPRHFLFAIAFSICIACVLGYSFTKAAGPQIWISAFANGQTSQQRTSQLLEVKSGGFDKGAFLEYTYVNNMNLKYHDSLFGSHTKETGAYFTIFETNRTSDLYTLNYNGISKGESKTSTAKFFAMQDGESGVGTFSITAKDINPKSSTYGKTATTTMTNAAWSDLATDINTGVGTMFVGERKQLRELLATAGMPMFKDTVEYPSSGLEDVWMSVELEGTKMEKVPLTNSDGAIREHIYPIESTKPGRFQVSLMHLRNFILHDQFYGNYVLLRWDFGRPRGNFDVYVFDKRPDVTPGLKTITLTNTIAGVTYSLGYESFTPSKDGEEIVFGKNDNDGFLMSGQTFQVEMSKRVNGKNARMFIEAKTNGTSYVNFDNNGVTPEVSMGNKGIPYDTKNLSEYALYADGYDFLGWNEKPDGTGIDYSKETVNREYLTVYAQWFKKHYNADIQVQLEGVAYTGAQVGLYQNGKQIYPLKDEGNGHYTGSKIAYSVYSAEHGAYDIYVDGVDSGLDYKLSGKEVDNTTINSAVHCFNVSVNLQNENAVWSDQKVELNKDGINYELKFDTKKNLYTRRMMYDTPVPIDGPYLIFVNNKLIQNDSTLIQHTITNDPAKNVLTFSYYNISFELKKDGVAWDKGAEVTLRQKNAIKYTLPYNSTTQKHELTGIIDFGQSYDVFVKGSNSKEQTGKMIDATKKSESANYYSVFFKDDGSIYNTQILYENEMARKPSVPYKEGNTFAYWSANDDGSGDKYFQGGVNVTPPITATTTIYATWQKPSLALGTYLRCDENGVATGKGKYYRTANIAILGFPGGSGKTPIRKATFSTSSGSSTINVINLPAGYKVDGNGTKDITIYFKNGVTMKEAEDFLKNNVIIKPDAGVNPHTLVVRVFGVTG